MIHIMNNSNYFVSIYGPYSGGGTEVETAEYSVSICDDDGEPVDGWPVFTFTNYDAAEKAAIKLSHEYGLEIVDD